MPEFFFVFLLMFLLYWRCSKLEILFLTRFCFAKNILITTTTATTIALKMIVGKSAWKNETGNDAQDIQNFR
jgi:hypothetical protein